MIFFYILYCIFNEIVGFLFYKNHISREYLYIIFTVVEYCFFALFFYYIVRDKLVKRFLPFIVLFFIIASILDVAIITNESFTSGVQAVLILIMCIYYFFYQIKKPNSFLIYTDLNFWIIISFLIYVAGTFFLYIIHENTTPTRAFLKEYAIINFSFNLLKNILLSIAMLMKEEKITPTNFGDSHLQEDWKDIQSIKNLS